MGIPELTLRFRNASKGDFLAIGEHQAIIAARGTVLWGWWKRKEEDERDDIWSTTKTPLSVTLISTSEKLQYTATVEKIYRAGPPDLAKVPEYYRDNVSRINTWLEISEIKEVEYSSEIADRVSNQTKTVFTTTDLLKSKTSYQQTLHIDVSTGLFVLISDIHLFEGEHAFLFPKKQAGARKDDASDKVYTLAQAIKKDLLAIGAPPIAGVLVSGDIVSRGSWPADLGQALFQELSSELNVDKQHIFCVPGNHDFYRQDKDPAEASPLLSYEHEYPYKIFRSQVFQVDPNDPLNYCVAFRHKDFEVRIGFLNSARWTATPNFSEYGYVGRDVYASVIERMKADASVCWKVLVMHHHLLPLRSVERPGSAAKSPVSVTLDSVDILEDALAHDVSLVCHGHQHIPDLLHFNKLLRTSSTMHRRGLHVLASGSAGSTQLDPGAVNTYSLLNFDADKLQIRVRRLDPSGRNSGDVFTSVIDR